LRDAVQIGLFGGIDQSALMLRQLARLPGFAALSELGAAISLAIAGSLSVPGHRCQLLQPGPPGPLTSIPSELAETGDHASRRGT
jgi:hypothetical protein